MSLRLEALENCSRCPYGYQLLKWFRNDLYNIDFLTKTEIENNEIPSQERLRFISNKYRGTRYEKYTRNLFKSYFIIHDRSVITKIMGYILSDDKRINYSDPIKYLNESLWSEKSPRGYLNLIDLSVYFMLKIK
jgi:hypothetical protein